HRVGIGVADGEVDRARGARVKVSRVTGVGGDGEVDCRDGFRGAESGPPGEPVGVGDGGTDDQKEERAENGRSSPAHAGTLGGQLSMPMRSPLLNPPLRSPVSRTPRRTLSEWARDCLPYPVRN